MRNTTTIRVTRRTRELFIEVAAFKGRTLTELLEELAERERRQHILDQSVARMTEIMADPKQRAEYLAELHRSEVVAADVTDA